MKEGRNSRFICRMGTVTESVVALTAAAVMVGCLCALSEPMKTIAARYDWYAHSCVKSPLSKRGAVVATEKIERVSRVRSEVLPLTGGRAFFAGFSRFFAGDSCLLEGGKGQK